MLTDCVSVHRSLQVQPVTWFYFLLGPKTGNKGRKTFQESIWRLRIAIMVQYAILFFGFYLSSITLKIHYDEKKMLKREMLFFQQLFCLVILQ